ncbi:ycf20-like protein [Amborella trichopoda]|uniref:ycf20-like protein n=1 Tax=Amborella trichopoda TaxID=13333 RepID=UPI0009C16F43|nr:ycf20-like protein [Amborella trichopoda]XP_020529090.1 ycf20-like protein [Amborella trichopoda]|eukprot:XP_020529089.1 ycf20-like protein [Amborella trichopoda]
MVMATKLLPLPNCRKSILFPNANMAISRDCIVDHLHMTGFDCGRRLFPCYCSVATTLPSLLKSPSHRKLGWLVKNSQGGGQLNSPERSGTRLIRALRTFQIRLIAKIEELKKGFPKKLLCLLVGFYCATAFATVIGQTGDWDVLSAGLAVMVVEGIGALMYKASSPLFERLRFFITLFNYWKVGLSLGLFLDAFKYEMDAILGFITEPFNFEIDLFPMFL